MAERVVEDLEVEVVEALVESDFNLQTKCLGVLENTVSAMEDDLARCENISQTHVNTLIKLYEERDELFRQYLQCMVTETKDNQTQQNDGIFKVIYYFIAVYVHILVYILML